MQTMRAHATRESLVAALAARQLDRTLTSALPLPDQYDDQVSGATGLQVWDEGAGGFPRGQLSEIVGPASSGRMSVLLRMVAAATGRGELVAYVDALDQLDPASAEAAGVSLDRMLWVRGHVRAHSGLTRDAVPRAVEQALKALTLILQAGNFGLVALDLSDAPQTAIRRLPFTTWLRVQRMLEGQPTIGVLVGREPMARSAAGLTLALTRTGAGPSGLQFEGPIFKGMAITARSASARAQADRTVSFSTTVAAQV
jgi:hypothetical protein